MRCVMIAVLLLCAGTMTGTEPTTPSLRNRDDLQWVAGTGAVVQTSILAGDPKAQGEYVIRSRIPASQTMTRAHKHPTTEYGTVISGTLLVGIGEHPERAAMKRLGPGAFIIIPPGTWHYVLAETDVELQQHGMGPRETVYAD